jgi:hypothetical protein
LTHLNFSNKAKAYATFFFFFASSLGIEHQLSDVELSKRKEALDVSLVISHCDVSLDWIPGYIDDKYKVQDITVYSKCNKPVEGIDRLKSVTMPQIIRLPNVGQCDHSYAHWIKYHYASINRKKDGNDIVFFFKDNNYHSKSYRPFDEVFSLTSELGFSCALKPIWCDCPEGSFQCKPNSGLTLHNQTELEAFEMRHRHVRLDRDDGKVDTFVSDVYPNMKSWKDSMGLVTIESKTSPVCYGGVFAVKKERVLDQSKDSWDNVEKSLTREDNLVEGHYAERMWASILSGKDAEYAKTIDDFIVPHINQTSRCIGRPGMILVPKGMSELYKVRQSFDMSMS